MAAQWQQWTWIQVERLKEMPLTFTLTHDFKKLGWAFASIIGGEADLLRLQKELTERCPQARIALA
jgi:hypothetical protein